MEHGLGKFDVSGFFHAYARIASSTSISWCSSIYNGLNSMVSRALPANSLIVLHME